MIYCGLPCIGKTTASKILNNVIELDSSKYYDKEGTNGLERYILEIQDQHLKGNVVLCSSHKEVRDLLFVTGVDYTFVTYEDDMLEEVINRSESRQPHPLKTEVVIENFENFIKPMDGEKVIKLNKDVPFISNVLINRCLGQ